MPEHLLCIDIGNTLSKAAVYAGDRVVETCSGPTLDVARLAAWKHEYGLRNKFKIQ